MLSDYNVENQRNCVRSTAPRRRWHRSVKVNYILGMLVGMLVTLMFLFGVFDGFHGFHGNVERNSEEVVAANESLVETLKREVRILCMVVTAPKYHQTRAIHVKRTWGRRCTRLLFITSEPAEQLGDHFISPVNDTYQNLWGKLCAGFQHIHQNYLDEVDWIFKCDDDSYAFMENLRHLLYPYSPNDPLMFGYPFFIPRFRDDKPAHRPYMSGGSGYALSKEAVRLFVEEALTDPEKCPQIDRVSGAEDVDVGMCLENVNVVSVDSRDDQLRVRFGPFEPFALIIPTFLKSDHWFHLNSYYKFRSCRDCLSKYTASFHYVNYREMYLYEFLKYEMQLMSPDEELPLTLPKKISFDEIIVPLSDNIDKI